MTDTERLEIATNWFNQLEQRDLDQLVSLYSATQLSFHPTFWNEHIRDCRRARHYFVDFLARRPKVHSFQGDLFSLGDHAFLYTGTMTLSFANAELESEKPITARFSFVWENEGDNHWRIRHHHNSVVRTN